MKEPKQGEMYKYIYKEESSSKSDDGKNYGTDLLKLAVPKNYSDRDSQYKKMRALKSNNTLKINIFIIQMPNISCSMTYENLLNIPPIIFLPIMNRCMSGCLKDHTFK